MPASDITVRECVSFEDFRQCVDLELKVWKSADLDAMPLRLYQISKACGAPTFGAFDGGKLVGFGHTMLALVESKIGPQVAYHSHMVAVTEELRDRAIGYRIKVAQRQHAIDAGIPLIFWTFDPLQSRNAHLNINKLGAIVRRYEVNYYGQGVATGFDADVPTDRLIAEWWVSSEHVRNTLEGKQPVVPELRGEVTIPDEIGMVRARSVREHLEWRQKSREGFLELLGAGFIVRGFARDPAASESRYLFGPDDRQFTYSAYAAGGGG
jgi:predicted GNAT superfamily acetyltransferase